MIESQFLKLHFSQLVNAWKLSRYNTYSNVQKQIYHEHLAILFSELKKTNFDTISTTECTEIKEIIDFFIQSLNFLNNSTINNVPYELIECLRLAMKDWIDNHDDYIIVTSYNDYSFNPSLVMLTTYTIIEAKFKIKFERKLVQINLPKHLERDYLCNAVLYHELGHFIDQVQSIYKSISDTIWNNRTNRDCIKYFPYILSTSYPDDYKRIVLANHVMEYFADIFASQYIQKASYHYLSYIAKDCGTSETHPATLNRIIFINEFLGGSPYNFVLETFISETLKQTQKEIKYRSTPLSCNDFLNLIPCIITEPNQLHSLFLNGWEIWINDTERFQAENNMTEALRPSQIYQIINNLIEKSINNFIVIEKWKKSSQLEHI